MIWMIYVQRKWAEARQHARAAALEGSFSHLMPDFLEDVTLYQLGVICSGMEQRRMLFLLEAEHVAAKPVSVDTYMDRMVARLRLGKSVSFVKLFEGAGDRPEFVGMFLAVLELYKRGRLDVSQEEEFGEITVVLKDREEAS